MTDSCLCVITEDGDEYHEAAASFEVAVRTLILYDADEKRIAAYNAGEWRKAQFKDKPAQPITPA